MEWFYNGLGGISQDENAVGYSKITIAPDPVGDLIWVKTSFLCPYGKIKSEWKKESTRFELNVEVPVGTAATVYLPALEDDTITESGSSIQKSGLIWLGYKEGKAMVGVKSGNYHFVVVTKK
jgi:hypothetical protein